jgi:hypothetical protein
MFRYPVEKQVIRFYKYKIFNSEIAIIETSCQIEARRLLKNFIVSRIAHLPVVVRIQRLTPNEIIYLLAISESLSLPITGETEKVVDDVECVWDGKGWMPIWEYEKNEI